MRFRTPLTPEEQEAEAEAKAQVLAMFSVFRKDITSGPESQKIVSLTWQNLALILLTCVLYLTHVIGTTVFLWLIMLSFTLSIPLGIAALYYAKKDHESL